MVNTKIYYNQGNKIPWLLLCKGENMNEQNVILQFWKKIIKVAHEIIENPKCDKTFKATIWKINSDDTYSINYKNKLYDVPNALGTSLSLGQTVWVKIPSGIFRDMHISGIARKRKG